MECLKKLSVDDEGISKRGTKGVKPIFKRFWID